MIIEESGRKVVVVNCQASEQKLSRATELTHKCLQEKKLDKEIALALRKEFDSVYKPNWHCVVGRVFGSCVTYFEKQMLYFYIGQVAVLLFRTKS